MTKTLFLALIAFSIAIPGSLSAQAAAVDPSERLKEVLPAEVAERVLLTIAEARARELPAQALANRALKFAARGVDPLDIEQSVHDHALRLDRARGLLNDARDGGASAEELEAGSEALRMGVNAETISGLAKSAPSGRSLSVPLFVIGSLVDRGLPSDQALRRVLERLRARTSDSELERLPAQTSGEPAAPGAAAGAAQSKGLVNRPGNAAGGAGRGPAAAGGRPASLPPNPGKGQGKGPPNALPGQP